MTVAELIEKLRAMPQDMAVQIYYGYDAELGDAETVEINEHGYHRNTDVVVIK